MEKDLSLQAREKAGNYFRDGYNCAESVFLALHDLLQLPVDRNAVKMLTGFGGGLGHAGDVCGALVASTVVLNTLYGRTDNKGKREPAYATAHEFHDRFRDKFGATCCRDLNKEPFDTPEHLRSCLKLTGNTAKLLAEYLQEKELNK